MTIKIPDSSTSDKILKYFGKKRGLIFPKNIHEKYGHSVYAKAIKENFWKALLRPKNKQLPNGVVDYDTFKEGHEQGSNN